MLIKTDFRHVIALVQSPSGDDHTSIGREASDIKRKYPAKNIDFADERFSAPHRALETALYIVKSESEGRKHLLDRSITAHGRFEDVERASK